MATFYELVRERPDEDVTELWREVHRPIDRLLGLAEVTDDDMYQAAEIVLDHIRERDSENAHLLFDRLCAVFFRALANERVLNPMWAAHVVGDLEEAFARYGCRRWYS